MIEIIKTNILTIIKKVFHIRTNNRIGKNSIINDPNMLEIGNNCSIGPNAVIYCIYKKIIIGNNVMIGPNVTMVNGDHNIRKVGIPIIDNHEKDENDDKEIIIEDDVWIGANVTILKGVKIGRGAVIAAGAILSKSVMPYCIVGGINKVLNVRFTTDQIIIHEKIIYPLEKRLTIDELEHIVNFKNKKQCQNQD